MFEANAVERIAELDVDTEVVRIQLELVAEPDGGVFLHVQRQSGDLAVK